MRVKVKNTPSKKVKIKSVPKADMGMQVLWGGGLQPLSSNPYTGGTIQFNGQKHSQSTNGLSGIGMNISGVPVEVEGQETGFHSNDGSFHVLGNMEIPGTKKKFKTMGKEIAKDEQKANGIMDKSSPLIQNKDPYNKYQALSFNSGKVMEQGSKMRLKDLAQQKEDLATIQQHMLDTADAMGIEPQKLSKKMWRGGGIWPDEQGRLDMTSVPKFADGGSEEDTKRLSVAQRHNNPGNLKFAPWMKKYGAMPGEPGTDGGRFAKFPDTTSGLSAMQNLLKSPSYKNLTVADAIKKWTGGSGYSIPLGDIATKKISDLNPGEFQNLTNKITFGEDGRYYDPTLGMKKNPITLPEVGVKPSYTGNFGPKEGEDLYRPIGPEGNRRQIESTPGAVEGNQNYFNQPQYQTWPVNTNKKMPSLADRNKLGISDIIPELAGIFQRPDNVAHERYQPQLYTPYNVSFQDRLNENNASFRAISQQLNGNTAALNALAANKYKADSSVLGEQFRTNQGIQNDITNKNVSLINDARMKNLQLSDQQYVRQEQAKANTKMQQREAIASLAQKIAQNRQENNNIRLLESRSNYRMDPQGNVVYMGPNAQWSAPTAGSMTGRGYNPNNETRTYYDANGNPVKTEVIDHPEYQDIIQQQKARAAQYNMRKWGGRM